MNTLLGCLASGLMLATGALAQDPTPPTPPSPAPAASRTNASAAADANATNRVVETLIDSDHWQFDLKSRLATYTGNVRVNDPRMKLTCERLLALIPNSGGQIDDITAETNVVITALDSKGLTNFATAGLAIYHYSVTNGITNEIVELSESPIILSPRGTMRGEVIRWDKGRDEISASKQHTLLRGDRLNDTNSPVAPTNAPPAGTHTVRP